jgi:hypothetical protein
MKEIIEINKRILIEAPGIVPPGEDCIFASRDGRYDEELQKLPPAIKADLDALRAQISEVVPNDFSYALSLGDYNPTIALEFRDGATAFATCNETFNPEASIIEQLKVVNWDKHRSFGMSGGQIFDGIREFAKEAEPELPPTSEIQKGFAHELEAFTKTKRQGAEHIFLLMHRHDEGVTEKSCRSMKELRGNLCDLMTCQYDIIAIMTDKKLLPPRKVDKLKREVLLDMKESMPISYARAVGLF